MLEGLRARWEAIGVRLRRIERRELRELRAWLEDTRNLIHVSALLFVPLLIAAVTALSNAVSLLPFLLFPPLASGTYTLFAEPESRYASPRRFVGGMTIGALCGWAALETTARYWYHVPPDGFEVRAGAAALAIFLTGASTWLLDLEESQSFSTALLVLIIEPASGLVPGLVPGQTGAAFAYVLSVFVSTSIVAAAFVGWRRWFYERRARFLYASTSADDAVLVPVRDEASTATAMLGARLAAAHGAGKVVLLNLVDEADVAETEAALLSGREEGAKPDSGSTVDRGFGGEPRDRGGFDGDVARLAEERVGSAVAESLEREARRIEATKDVPCEVAVLAGDADDSTIVLEAARRLECDLIVAPYGVDERGDGPSSFVRGLLAGTVDAVVHRSGDERTEWRRVLVPVRSESDIAHAMIDFAIRLAGPDGEVSVCHCLGENRSRRCAEDLLANLVEPFDGDSEIETRVATASLEEFLADHAPLYDLALVGSSTDRSKLSRFISPPTAERLEELECDLAVVSTARA